jgi:hypothetical protein
VVRAGVAGAAIARGAVLDADGDRGTGTRVGTGGGDETRAEAAGGPDGRGERARGTGVGSGGGVGRNDAAGFGSGARMEPRSVTLEGRGDDAGGAGDDAIVFVNSAAARASARTRSSLPSRSACSAARRSHRAASRRSPCASRARAVSSASTRSSESDASHCGVREVLNVSRLICATMRHVPFRLAVATTSRHRRSLSRARTNHEQNGGHDPTCRPAVATVQISNRIGYRHC